jgi:hypothetical protein
MDHSLGPLRAQASLGVEDSASRSVLSGRTEIDERVLWVTHKHLA